MYRTRLSAKTLAKTSTALVKGLFVAGFTGVLLCILAGAFALGQVGGSQQVSVATPTPMSATDKYYHFLMAVNHGDRMADLNRKYGKNFEWLRHVAQNELGFTDKEFAPIRAAAQRLEAELGETDGRIRGIDGSREARPLPSSELKTLRQQHVAMLATEVADLQRALGPKAAGKLNSYVQNHVHGSLPPAGPQNDSLGKYGLFLVTLNRNVRASAEKQPAETDGNGRPIFNYQKSLGFTDSEFALVCLTAQRVAAMNDPPIATARATVKARSAIPPSPELIALNQECAAIVEKEVADLQRTLGPGLASRLDAYLRTGFGPGVATADLDSERARVFDISTPARQKRRPGEKISPDYRIDSLQIDRMSMLGALLAIGRQLHIPLGIRYLDNQAVQKPVRIHWNRNSGYPPHVMAPDLGRALTAILPVDAGYTWEIRGHRTEITGDIPEDGSVVVKVPYGSPIEIDNWRATSDSKDLLNFRLENFAIPRCTLEEANHRLQTALAMALNPTAAHDMAGGDCQTGTGKGLVGPIKLRRRTLAEVLDELVAEQGNVAWVVQVPPEALDHLAPGGLWRIIDYDDPAFDQAIAAVKENFFRYPPSSPQTSSGTVKGAR
ncbi:MAG: hypothetical protein P4N24_10850 [Acidobacteriota bacterium]|nr:hypothetical protein [Acidobacteriota bacterium]